MSRRRLRKRPIEFAGTDEDEVVKLSRETMDSQKTQEEIPQKAISTPTQKDPNEQLFVKENGTPLTFFVKDNMTQKSRILDLIQVSPFN